MTTFLVCCLGAGVLIEQDLPSLNVEEIDAFSGHVGVNFLRRDMDGDGAIDLLLPDRVYFQRDGGYPAASSVPIPNHEINPLGDLDGATLYLRLPGRVEAHEWWNGAWRQALGHEIDWPDQSLVTASPNTRNGVRYDRFLHDFDGDGIPEIVAANALGLHVFRRSGEVVFRSNTIEIFPPVRPLRTHESEMWPVESRVPRYPILQSAFDLHFGDGTIEIVQRDAAGIGAVRFRFTRYRTRNEAGFSLQKPESWASGLLPEYMQPCHLNTGTANHFAGARSLISHTSALAVPLVESSVSLDGGTTIQTIRTHGYRPRCLFTDMDGDGDDDWIAESTLLFNGGLRETISRFMTAEAVEHEVRIYSQAEGRFVLDAPARIRFTIALGEPAFQQGVRFREYRNGRLVDVTGDFNGDGRRDIAVHAKLGNLSIYFNTGSGFSSKPDQTVPIGAEQRFAVADIDGDGRSDVIIRRLTPWRETTVETVQTLLSREP